MHPNPNLNTMPSEAEELITNGARTSRGKPWIDRTHCSKGHPFDAQNTLWRTDSSPNARRCRECKRQRYRDYYERRGRQLRGYQASPADDPRRWRQP